MMLFSEEVRKTHTSALKRSCIFGLDFFGDWANKILMLDHVVSKGALLGLAIFLSASLWTVLTVA
jgi:hypothetical protein